MEESSQQPCKLAINHPCVSLNPNLVTSEATVQAGSAQTGGQTRSRTSGGEFQAQVEGAALLGEPFGHGSKVRLASPETRSRAGNKPDSKGREAAVCRVSPFVAAEIKA